MAGDFIFGFNNSLDICASQIGLRKVLWWASQLATLAIEARQSFTLVGFKLGGGASDHFMERKVLLRESLFEHTRVCKSKWQTEKK